MSPRKLYNEGDEQARKEVINGPRPSPLRINKDSHVVQKPSSSSFYSTIIYNSTQVNLPPKKHQNQTANHQTRQPVIIYTHSPKIIHTQARDFMALVQKLTGLSRSDEEEINAEGGCQDHQKKDQILTAGGKCGKDNESSSVIADEKYGGGGGGDGRETSSVSPMFKMPYNSYFGDIPLFTPNSSDFFCSPRPFSMSPSFLEVMRGLPEY